MKGFEELSSTLAGALDDLVRRLEAGLVVVHGHRDGAGAGIIWNPDGLILTNAHVVGRGAARVLLHDDREFEARLVSRDPEVDLALMEIEARDLPAVRPAESLPHVGEMVFAVGHPWGQRGYVSSGIVSAIGAARTRGRRGSFPVIRSDVPLAPGNSGGPLVNAAGELLGINTMIVGGDQSVAIPAWIARQFIGQATSSQSRPQHHWVHRQDYRAANPGLL